MIRIWKAYECLGTKRRLLTLKEGSTVNVEEKAEICTEQSPKKTAKRSHLISHISCSTQLAFTFMAAP